MVRISIVFLILQFLNAPLSAQIELEYIQPRVLKNGEILTYAFAGGVNSAQYQSIDLDNDEDLDLILFDRSSNKVNCFENIGSSYVYQPAFEYSFPQGLSFWLVLEDYNCDGRKDLFTYTNLGIRVFENINTSDGISWSLVADPIKTQGSSSQINLFFNPTDIPSIKDLDNDGDLDILVFDFASSSQIEFHKNYSFDNTGSCGLSFVRETRSYGDILDCDCDAFTVNEPCSSSARVLHAGGKALLSLDYNADGKMDLLLSQEACENLNYTENNGSLDIASFEPFNNTFPTFNSTLGFSSFPIANYEDVTFDGNNDLIISSNERSNSQQNIDFKNSSLLYANQGVDGVNLFNNSKPFLQHKMIDVGEYAYPAIIDINGDGNNDLVIGNSGSLVAGTYISTITYYKANTNGLEWITDDLFELSDLGFTSIKPQFIDINGDGNLDLVFSATDSGLNVRLGYILNSSESMDNFNTNALQFITSDLGRLDDYFLEDVNQDNLPDLLIGTSGGELNYYLNTGTLASPSFSLETSSYLGIVPNGDRSNLSLTVGDIDADGNQDLVTTDRSGVLSYYSNYQSGQVSSQESLIKLESSATLAPSQLGRISKPAIGDLLGRRVLAIGSIQGGVRLLATSDVSNGNQLNLTAFPVPTTTERIVTFQSNLSNTSLEIFDLLGHKVLEIALTAYSDTKVNLSHLKDGLYLAKAQSGNENCTLKIVVKSID